MQGWLDTTETGDRAELEVEPSDALWAELAVGADRCSGRRCAFHGTCFAEAARDRASSADLVIANHALVLRRPGRGRRCAAGARRRRLRRGAPARGVGRVVARRRRLARGPAPARARRRARVPRAAGDAARAAPSTGSSARASGCSPPSRRRPGAGACASRRARRRCVLGDALAALALELQGHGEELDGARPPLRCRRRRRSRRCSTPTSRSASSGPSRARSPGRRSTSRPSCATGSGRRARPPILVSATLTAGEDARFVRRRLGLDRAREAVVGSPYDFGEQALLYLPQAMPDPRSDEFIGARRRRDRLAALALGRARARAHVELPRARRVPRPRPRAACPTTCSSRARRRASGCSSGSATRSTRCCSPRRRSGRGSTSPASRCRCS